MPLDIVRLFGSRFHAVATDAEWRAGVTLWLKSFHQVPAGSVPNDDIELCRLAELGRDMRTWKKVRANALHGWILCDDNRFYHPVVCEKAVEAWAKRVSYRERGKKGNEKRWKGADRQDERGGSEAPGDGQQGRNGDDCATAEGSQGHRLAIAAASQGTGTGTVYVPNGTSGEPPVVVDDLADLRAAEISKGSFALALRVLVRRGGQPETKARTLVGKWLHKDGLTPEDLWDCAEQTWAKGTDDPLPYLTALVLKAIERRAGATGIIGPSERQQRAWMQDWLEGGEFKWKRHERGPIPGEPGCRIDPTIQAEFQRTGAAA